MLIAQHQHKRWPDLWVLLIDDFDIEGLASRVSATLPSEDSGMVGACWHMNRFMLITGLHEWGAQYLIGGEDNHLIDEVAQLQLFANQLIQITDRRAEKAGFRVMDDHIRVEAKLLLTQLEQGEQCQLLLCQFIRGAVGRLVKSEGVMSRGHCFSR